MLENGNCENNYIFEVLVIIEGNLNKKKIGVCFVFIYLKR